MSKTNEQLAEELALKAMAMRTTAFVSVKAAILSEIPLAELIAVARAADEMTEWASSKAVRETLTALKSKLPEL